MDNKKKVIMLVLVFIILMGGAYMLYDNLSGNIDSQQLSSTEMAETNKTEYEENESNENPAPDFYVFDGDGNKVNFSDLKGKPMILNLWASWCGPCKKEMPDFNELYAQYGEDIEFMMINMTDGQRETVEKAKKFVEDQGYDFPVYFDTDRIVAYTYSANTIPATYFIDADGNLVAYGSGMLSKENIESGIEMITE